MNLETGQFIRGDEFMVGNIARHQRVIEYRRLKLSSKFSGKGEEGGQQGL